MCSESHEVQIWFDFLWIAGRVILALAPHAELQTFCLTKKKNRKTEKQEASGHNRQKLRKSQLDANVALMQREQQPGAALLNARRNTSTELFTNPLRKSGRALVQHRYRLTTPISAGSSGISCNNTVSTMHRTSELLPGCGAATSQSSWSRRRRSACLTLNIFVAV